VCTKWQRIILRMSIILCALTDVHVCVLFVTHTCKSFVFANTKNGITTATSVIGMMVLREKRNLLITLSLYSANASILGLSCASESKGAFDVIFFCLWTEKFFRMPQKKHGLTKIQFQWNLTYIPLQQYSKHMQTKSVEKYFFIIFGQPKNWSLHFKIFFCN